MTGRTRALSGAVVLVAAMAAALWYANRPGPSPARAGDCVTAPANGSFKTVGCTDSGAAFKVAAVLTGGDSNDCDAYPTVILSVVSKDRAKTLCLDSAK